MLAFLSTKFTRESLYGTMVSQLAILQKQAWTAALDRLNAARAAFDFDFSPLETPPLPTRLWDGAPNGLLSADALMMAAQSLETAYMSRDQRRLELTRTFSLKQINPFALIRLRETGRCAFTLHRALFDLDNPGHFDRRIADVRLSIPGVTGPYVPISATLQLVSSTIRDVQGQTRKINLPQACSVIVTSTGRDDAGLFQPDRPDDRYGPFEGGGCESDWTIDLPDYRHFPYRRVPDVLVTVRYRAQRDVGSITSSRDAVAAALDGQAMDGARKGSFHLASARPRLPR